MPAAVADALNGELATLAPGAQAFLRGAAVSGDPFDDELAAVAAGLPDNQAIAALDELASRELLRPTDVPAASGSGTRSSAGRSTRARRPGGVGRRTVGWPTRYAGTTLAAGSVAHHVERSAATGDEEAVSTPSGGRSRRRSQGSGDRSPLVSHGVAHRPGPSEAGRRLEILLAPVASALAAELAALHPTARRLLEGASVVGELGGSAGEHEAAAPLRPIGQLLEQPAFADARFADHLNAPAVSLSLEPVEQSIDGLERGILMRPASFGAKRYGAVCSEHSWSTRGWSMTPRRH